MPWPKETRYLGKPATRVDAPAKVAGLAKYASDMTATGVLHGAIFRAPWPAAKVVSIDLSRARSAPGIKAAILAREGPRQVRYYGEELAALAGTSKQAVEDALRLIHVDAQPLPFVVDELDAIGPASPPVIASQANLSAPHERTTGDVDTAFASAAAVVEGTFSVPVVLHHPLETHGNTVAWTDEEITVWASTQGVFSVRDGMADNLDVPHSRVRVVCDHMGGGFGAKLGPGIEGSLCARLSQAAGAPVRLMLTRFDQSLAVGNRPSSFQHLKLGADADGRLTAFAMTAFGSPGFTAGATTAAGSGGASVPMPYIYPVPNVRVRQANVSLNGGSSRPMRAPAHPQASFGMESILDELAVKLGLDPVELRLRNDPFEVRQREYRIGAERFGWKEKYRAPGSSPGPVKTGIGCAGATWGGGGRGTRAEVQINPDGTVEVRCGTQDLGTGSRTVVTRVAAEVLQLEPSRIVARIGDTRFPPSGGSGGSMTTASVSPAIFDACENAVAELAAQTGIAEPRGAAWDEACRKLGVTPLVVAGKWREGLSSQGAGGVQFAEVAVDTETGFVKLQRILCVQDCGLIVNPLAVESQVNGGIIMGIGYALYEQRVMDRVTGAVLNPNFETYKLPGAADIPPIEIVLLDMPERGVIGVGEPVTIPTAAAIANAVANALGVRVPSLPLTPDKVLAALGRVPAHRTSGSRDAAIADAMQRIAGAPPAGAPKPEAHG
ncbi:MAG TPA: xanthine dehydrogenase family protein molybdopterin-binding subunit [Opitutaceae bacterium]